MTLKEANKKLEELENDYEYYLNEKEELLSLVLPKATNITSERVDGGTREDKMMKYVETEEEKKINDTLDYIDKKKQNLMRWIDNELRMLNKYEETEQLIVYYKEIVIKNYTWEQISQLVHYSVSQCKRIYKRYKKRRNIQDDLL